jgi:CelD/BcsL family acetyltransferase involved in cellulose biosynthesis
MTTEITPPNAIPLTFRSYNPFTEFEEVKSIWTTLLDKCPHSYFTSWGWIFTWLHNLPPDLDVKLIVAQLQDRPVIAFFIGRSAKIKYKFMPVRTISLNSTANRYFDELTIEYNSMLFDPEYPVNIESIFRYLKSLNWDEFRIPGASSSFISTFKLLDHTNCSFYLMVDRNTSSFFVELQKIRDAGMDYLQLLSANKRSQIRRSIKQYELDGSIQIHEAANSEEAQAMLDQLASLHQNEWIKRGEAGSFSNRHFYQFHRNLIQTRFNSNEIQLLHIFTPQKTIGYLYNFVYDNRVLFYQSGFNYSTENIYRPGLVSHYFAIMHNASKKMLTYDFLAGESSYKTSLSTNSTPMYWIRFIKSRSRYNFEKAIIKLKEILETRTKKEKPT